MRRPLPITNYGASLQLCTERGPRHRKVFERTDSDPPTFVADSKGI